MKGGRRQKLVRVVVARSGVSASCQGDHMPVWANVSDILVSGQHVTDISIQQSAWGHHFPHKICSQQDRQKRAAGSSGTISVVLVTAHKHTMTFGLSTIICLGHSLHPQTIIHQPLQMILCVSCKMLEASIMLYWAALSMSS